MTDLYFTAEGGEAEASAAIAGVKEMLFDKGVLERDLDEAGLPTIRNPRNVLGPRPGRAGTWYLALRTGYSLDELAVLTGLGWDRVVDGRLALLPGVLLHLPPPATDPAAWEALRAEFETVLGVWA